MGARHSQNKDEVVYYHPYIAFHDTKPERYCKVNQMNHFERSIMLRKKFDRMHRERNEQRNNMQQMQQRRKRHRKRKRTQTQLDDNLNKKRIKRLRSCSSSSSNHNIKRPPINKQKPNAIDIDIDFCIDAMDFKQNAKQNDNVSLFDSLNNFPKHFQSGNMMETLNQVLDEYYDST